MSQFDPEKPHYLQKLPPTFSVKDLLSDLAVVNLLVKANGAVRELKGTCRAIGNPKILMNIPLLQESVASSEIEGIHTTVESALEDAVKSEDERTIASKETLNYCDAIDVGFELLQKFSLATSRTILPVHEKLMLKGGGRFRDSQNKIRKGGKEIIYTPPPPEMVPSLMSDWEKYVHDDKESFDPLIKIAVSHYQFEAIHPFGDGNGRAGRILMVLQTVLYGLLDFPILYVSGYLVEHRDDYYRLLLSVTKDGNWKDFIVFMLVAIEEQATVTNIVIRKILMTRNEMKEKLAKELPKLNDTKILDHIFKRPYTFAGLAGQEMGITYQTASKYLAKLEQIGMLRKKKSGRHLFYYNVPLLKCMKT